MKTSDRIGILLFLNTRNELSPVEQLELRAWRRKSPANEQLYSQMSDPASLRSMILEYFLERDLAFEKLKKHLPGLAGTSLSGSVEDAAENYAEALVLEESGYSNFLTDESAESKLSPAGYWASMLSRLDDSAETDQEGGSENEVISISPKSKKQKVRRKGRGLRRLMRVAASLVAFFVLSYLSAEHRYDNYRAEMFSPGGGTSTIAHDFWRGFLAGFAGVKFGETEKGEPIYIAPGEPNAKKNKYYTLKTAPDGMFILQLADGSRIWMNASSTIKYPANINQDTIHIEVEGEVYIEISKDNSHHYLIYRSSVNGQRSTIEVRPSSAINFSTFPGQDKMLVTLIHGATQNLLGSPENNNHLSDGQQAIIQDDTVTEKRDIDKNEILAWKNGEIYYKNATIGTMAPAIARKYNVEIQYPVGIPDRKFNLRISKTAPISELLDSLRKQGLHSSQSGRVVAIWK